MGAFETHSPKAKQGRAYFGLQQLLLQAIVPEAGYVFEHDHCHIHIVVHTVEPAEVSLHPYHKHGCLLVLRVRDESCNPFLYFPSHSRVPLDEVRMLHALLNQYQPLSAFDCCSHQQKIPGPAGKIALLVLLVHQIYVLSQTIDDGVVFDRRVPLLEVTVQL